MCESLEESPINLESSITWYQPESKQMTDERIARAVELADGNLDPIRLAKRLPYYEEKARRFDFITGGAGGPLFKDHFGYTSSIASA